MREGVNHLQNCGKYRGTSLANQSYGAFPSMEPHNLHCEILSVIPLRTRKHTLQPLIMYNADRYLQLLKENREKGYRGQQQNYIPGVTGPELGGSTGRPDVTGYYPTVQQAKGERGTDMRKGATIGFSKEIY